MTTLIIGTALALPAMAQTVKPHHPVRHASTATPRPTENDKGPFTPEANAAYNGGGAILEGAPGGPPPPASAVLAMPPPQR